MAGRIIKEVPKPCNCTGKPDAKNYGEGTQWQCDCGKIFEVYRSYDPRDGSSYCDWIGFRKFCSQQP